MKKARISFSYRVAVKSENEDILLNKKKIYYFILNGNISSIQFSCSVGSALCDPMDCSMPGLPVHHQLLEFT